MFLLALNYIYLNYLPFSKYLDQFQPNMCNVKIYSKKYCKTFKKIVDLFTRVGEVQRAEPADDSSFSTSRLPKLCYISDTVHTDTYVKS